MNWGTGKQTVKLKDCGALRDRNSLHTIDMNNPAPGHERGDPESLMIRSVLSARLLELSQENDHFWSFWWHAYRFAVPLLLGTNLYRQVV